MKRFFSLVLTFALLLSLAAPVSAAESAAGTTLRLETAEGTVTVKDASGVGKTTRSGMRLYNGYALSTAAASSAYISLDETKAVKLDASAEAEIKKQGKKLEVAVTAGQLFFNVTEPLKTDESLNIRTATMVTGIRGSFGWVNGNQMGLLHGHVTLSCINPETGETRTIDVHSGEMVSYDQASSQSAESSLQEIGFVKEAITVEAVPAIAAEEVAKDETLQAQLREDVAAINVTELVESLPEKQAAEKAAEEAALSAVQAAAEAQEQTIAAESSAAGSSQGYADLGGGTAATGDSSDSSSSDSSSSGSSGSGSSSSSGSGSGGSGSGAPQPVSSTSVSEASGLVNAMSSYNSVTFTGTGTMETLTIPVGKTLTVAPGAELTLTGNISNLSSNTFINNGTVTITGTFDNGGGVGGTAGRFVNNGTLNIHDAGRFINHFNGTFTGNAPAEGRITYQYLVSYEANGGSAVEAVEYTSGTPLESVIHDASPAKEGHILTGWYTNAELTGKISKTDAVTGNLTLYAGWMQTDYNVTLNTNGGTINSGKVTGYTYGTGATLPTEVTRDNYTFGGWYNNEECTGTPVTAIAETETGDKTFYAKWTPKTYTVTLHTNDGTIKSGNVTGYTYGTGATLPTEVTRDNYTFGGWYDNNSCTGTAVTAIAATETGDKTFYAKWTPVASSNCSVELDIPAGIVSVTINGVEYTASQPPTFPAGTSISMTAEAADNNYTLDYSEVKAIPKDASATDTSATFPLKGGSYTVTSNVRLTISEPYYVATANTLSDVLGMEGITHIVIGDKADLTSEVPKGKTLLAADRLTIMGPDGKRCFNEGTIINRNTLEISGPFTNIGMIINNGILQNNGDFRNTGSLTGSGSIDNRKGSLTNDGYLVCGDFTNGGQFYNGSVGADGSTSGSTPGTAQFDGIVTNTSNFLNNNGYISFAGESVTNNGLFCNGSQYFPGVSMSLAAGTTFSNAIISSSTGNTATFQNYGSLENNGVIDNQNGATFCNYGPANFTNVTSQGSATVSETLEVNTKATLQGEGTFSGTLLCSKPE